jgi:dihydrofolate reductase
VRKIILSLHTSLDGFVAGPNGEMDWIKVDDEMFDLVGNFTAEADTALYGRVTYQMMQSYWPTAADQPGASKHDIEHSTWYNRSQKVVISATMNEKPDKTTVIGTNIAAEVQSLKEQPGKNILVFGSPRVAQLLIKHKLVDEYWLFVNPVILGNGICFFPPMSDRTELQLQASRTFSCGVTALHYIPAP